MCEKSDSSNEQTLTRVTKEKDQILALLRDKGFRITKQRRLILDIVFSHECTCCKEIYYEALAKDSSIGIATVYRMMNMLTDLGVFRAAVPYNKLCQISDSDTVSQGVDQRTCNGCRIILDDQKEIEISDCEWQQFVRRVVEEKGYSSRKISRVVLNTVSC